MKLVFIDNLKPGMVVAKDIEMGYGADIALIRDDTILTETMIQGMRQRGIRFAYIKERQSRRPLSADVFAAEKTRPKPRKLFVPEVKPTVAPKLRKEAIQDLEELFSSVTKPQHSAAQIIKHLDAVVEELVDSLQTDPNTLVNIHSLKSYDEYTFHHSLSVSVLSLAIGQYLGFEKEPLRRLGMSAIMHDIGKTAVPLEIINKPSRLTAEEFSVIKSHSPEGYEYLKKANYTDEEILESVLYHHEKVDGTGYPKGIEGDDIPLWSRIISVADVYDALTSNRPYRDPMQPGEAIEYLMGGTGTSFDYDVINAFIRKVELYPVGSTILLSNGWTAKVMNNENQMRPVIRVDSSGDIIDLYRDMKSYNLVVSKLIG